MIGKEGFDLQVLFQVESVLIVGKIEQMFISRFVFHQQQKEQQQTETTTNNNLFVIRKEGFDLQVLFKMKSILIVG